MPVATDRVAELRKAIQEKSATVDAYINDVDAVKVDGADVHVKEDEWKKVQAEAQAIKEIQAQIDMIQFGAQTKAYLENPEGPSVAEQAQAYLKEHGHRVKDIKSLGEMFIESDEFKDMIAAKKLNSLPMELEGIHDIATGVAERKDVFPGITGGAGYTARPFGSIQFDPLNLRPHRTARVRDLFPAVSTSATTIDYFRVLGYTNGAASSPTIGDSQNKAKSVADRRAADGTSAPTGGATDVFGVKPQTRLAFDSQIAPVRTIAHWEAAHRNILNDMPQLRGVIDNELLYGLRLEEDRQILSGSGTNDELLGILQTTGIQTYSQTHGGTPDVATEQLSDALRRAATKVVIANFQATGYVLHPNDWEKVELQKAAGDGQYMLVTNIAIGAQTQVWRQPVVETVAIPEKTFLTGAFGLGAQLYDREQANIRVAEQHADFFIRNAIVVLCEERLALAVKRPEAFVKGTFF